MIRQKKTAPNKFKLILLATFLFLLIVHFIIKDRFQYLSVLYYACPLPLIIIYGIFVMALFYKRKSIIYVLSIVLLAMSVYFFSHYFGSEFKEKTSGESSHVLFWNVAQKEPLPTDILIKHIKESNPEIIALVEALDVSDVDLNVLKTAFPEYQFQALAGEMLIGAKGTIDTVVFASESDVYRYNYITLTIYQEPVSIMIADVYASPLLNKEIPLTIIRNAAQKSKVEILVGDFNTPYESVFFNEFKSTFNSFHPYSIGMSSTWPIPIPVIEIDQIWIGKSFQPIKMEKFSYDVSDHKLLMAEYK